MYDEEVRGIVQRNEDINSPCRKCTRCRERDELSKKFTL